MALAKIPLVATLALIGMLVSVNPIDGQATTETPEVTSTARPSAEFIDLPSTGELYQPLAFRIDIDPARYRNPFDPNDIDMIGILESPSGKQTVLPGFWLQPYVDACTTACTQENLQPSGNPHWEVRFTPDEPGAWTYTLQVRDDGTEVDARQGTLAVEPSDAHGFIGVGANNRYFAYDDGAPYFPIGHNLAWSWDGAGGLHAYDRWFKSLSESGGSYARLVVDTPWFVGLEWQTAGDYSAAQASASRLDAVLALAAKYQIRLQLVLLWHQALQVYTGPPVLVPEQVARPDTSADWNASPYNSARGGPLNSAALFFSNETARELFRRRLRYISARWGSDPTIFAWELIDEIDQTSGYNADTAAEWLREMATYLRQIDAGRHLITAGTRASNATLASVAPLDFEESAYFQRLPVETAGEQETTVISLMRRNRTLDRVPTLLTNYSLNPWYEPTDTDPTGVHFQNTLWAAALSGGAGGAMSAWGDTYVVAQGLERYYAPLAAFSAGVEWSRLALEPAEAGLLTDDADAYQPVRLTDFNRRVRAPIDRVLHTISGDGAQPPLTTVPSFLYGMTYNTQYHQPEQYLVTVPVDTYIEVGVRNVSDQGDARLIISVDGAAAGELAMVENTRGVMLRVPLTAGEHRITLDNTGTDWLEMDYIEIGALVAPARVLTLRDSTAGVALAWLQHRGYTWDQVAEGVERAPLVLTYRLDGMPPGLYAVDLWNPLDGGVLGEDAVRVGEDGVLTVPLLPMDRQMALRAFLQPPNAAGPTLELPPAAAPAQPIPSLFDQLGRQTPQPLATVAAAPAPLENVTSEPDIGR